MKIGFVVLGGIIGLVIVWLLPGVLTLTLAIIGIVVGVVVGFVLAALLIAQSRGEDPAKVMGEAMRQAAKPDPDARERSVYEPLVRANKDLRLDGNVSPTVLGAFESLIDKLLGVVPKAFELSSGSEATFDLEQLGSTHLPDYVGAYLELSPADRAQKEEAVLAELKKIGKVLDQAIARLNAGLVREFETQHAFMDLKF